MQKATHMARLFFRVSELFGNYSKMCCNSTKFLRDSLWLFEAASTFSWLLKIRLRFFFRFWGICLDSIISEKMQSNSSQNPSENPEAFNMISARILNESLCQKLKETNEESRKNSRNNFFSFLYSNLGKKSLWQISGTHEQSQRMTDCNDGVI